MNSWIIKSPSPEQFEAIQLADGRPSDAEKSAVISGMTLPVRARHRADKTNSFHEEQKLDGDNLLQLEAAIKV